MESDLVQKTLYIYDNKQIFSHSVEEKLYIDSREMLYPSNKEQLKIKRTLGLFENKSNDNPRYTKVIICCELYTAKKLLSYFNNYKDFIHRIKVDFSHLKMIYAKLDAECISNDGKTNQKTKLLSVIMRFDNEEQCEMVADEMFDTALTSFNEGLPDGWYIDESPEIHKYVTEKEAITKGYVVYKDDSS